MSLEWTIAVWGSPCASPTQQLVLLALADHAGEDGRAWPGLERLAQRTALSRKAVMEAIQALEAAGRIAVARQPGRGNRYRITAAAPPAAARTNQSPTVTGHPRAPVTDGDDHPSPTVTTPVTDGDPNRHLTVQGNLPRSARVTRARASGGKPMAICDALAGAAAAATGPPPADGWVLTDEAVGREARRLFGIYAGLNGPDGWEGRFGFGTWVPGILRQGVPPDEVEAKIRAFPGCRARKLHDWLADVKSRKAETKSVARDRADPAKGKDPPTDGEVGWSKDRVEALVATIDAAKANRKGAGHG